MRADVDASRLEFGVVVQFEKQNNDSSGVFDS